MSLQQPNADAWLQTYAYDPARRLTNTTTMAGGFGYLYDGTRHTRVGRLWLPNGARITIAFDDMGRLVSTALLNSVATNLGKGVKP
jgi:hypothetical protein